ncbi:MAG: Zn-dependent protease [Euryarchaeota archaeon]|nr:Zn-dependent protease [Euryarchaeota archaeon]
MTYSIIAKCPETGQYGVGIQSHFYGSGNACWARAGVGVVVTQAMALIDHGPLGLKLMEEGVSAYDALVKRLGEDPEPEIRQVAMLDSNGEVATHTGSMTIPAAGHVIGEGFSCQANLMWNDSVPQAMSDAFENSDGYLSERILSAMFAGQNAGGDIRGMQSGRILVVDSHTKEKEWEEVIVDVSVDDHPNPLKELGRLLKVSSVYSEFTNNGYEFELEQSEAEAFPEIAFWTAINLANKGELERGKELLGIALNDHDGWKELLIRCSQNSFFGITEELVAKLLQ